MGDGGEVFVPLEVRYSDLVVLSSPSAAASLSRKDLERIEAISDAVMKALGPSGPGLLSIAGVPKAPALRSALLPLARKLALLGNKERAQVLKIYLMVFRMVKECDFQDNGLGSDVPLKDPNRSVSSFAAQLNHPQILHQEPISSVFVDSKDERNNPHDLLGPQIHELDLLGYIFRELGLCMMELGLRLARVCDNLIGGRELEQSILDARTAKGRLIHYHSRLDNFILQNQNKRSKRSEPWGGSKFLPNEQPVCRNNRNRVLDLWQQWHYDYGIFTVLTSPLFLSSRDQEVCFSVASDQEFPSPDDHTYLRLFDSNHNRILLVKTSPESFIIQVGEAADILSKGRLHSTLHSVARPLETKNLSRETFVVFLQPPWDQVLSYPAYLNDAGEKNSDNIPLVEEILRNIPPLSSRLRDGMTFAEFSRETTKQYYGGSGTQSRRQ
ncbi:hypothetical protein AXF42_Ash020977 [Apostasia shenzhenica]|uniref:Uncharacterized protein n=1 Tax=Apostasia shenzhenica TaxID=1088818 RepID=A0A2H9ZZU4_9ASPA|nr:hypothetical protein AXF42_Ash020977 [Apostasia shenzhenica]